MNHELTFHLEESYHVPVLIFTRVNRLTNSHILQCIVVRYSVLQCVAMYCSDLTHYLCWFSRESNALSIVIYCSELQCVAVCCSVLQWLDPKHVLLLTRVNRLVHSHILQRVAACCSALQCVTVCCNMLQWFDSLRLLAFTRVNRLVHSHILQCVAVCCSVLQCVAVTWLITCAASRASQSPRQ